MMAIERKPLQKAPQQDVVDAFTNPPQPTPTSDRAPAMTPATPASPVAAMLTAGGRAGRPRNKRRMEPFSTKIEIGLRDRLDAYTAEHGISIVDFLDEAIADRLKK